MRLCVRRAGLGRAGPGRPRGPAPKDVHVAKAASAGGHAGGLIALPLPGTYQRRYNLNGTACAGIRSGNTAAGRGLQDVDVDVDVDEAGDAGKTRGRRRRPGVPSGRAFCGLDLRRGRAWRA